MLRICNTYCFFTATKVARTRLSVTLYVHCWSFLIASTAPDTRSSVKKFLSEAAPDTGMALMLQADLVICGNSLCCSHRLVRRTNISEAWIYFTIVFPSW